MKGVSAVKDVLIKNGRIEKIDGNIQPDILVTEINGEGCIYYPAPSTTRFTSGNRVLPTKLPFILNQKQP